MEAQDEPNLLITRQLLPKAAEGDRAALGEILSWLQSRLEAGVRATVRRSAVARQVQAEDVIQELLIKLGRLLARQNDKNPVNRRQLLGLATVLLKQVLEDFNPDTPKRRSQGTAVGGEELFPGRAQPGASRSPGPATQAGVGELSELVRQASKGLDEESATILTLRFVEELTYRDIAQRLGMDHKAVQRREQKALTYLRQAIADDSTANDDSVRS